MTLPSRVSKYLFHNNHNESRRKRMGVLLYRTFGCSCEYGHFIKSILLLLLLLLLLLSMLRISMICMI